MSDYLLLETGDPIALESGDGYFLLDLADAIFNLPVNCEVIEREIRISTVQQESRFEVIPKEERCVLNMSTYVKAPNAILDYGFDLEEWLLDGEIITDSGWTIPAGLTKVDEDFNASGTAVWLSGGTLGEDYVITNHIKTSEGREDDRSHTIKVRSR